MSWREITEEQLLSKVIDQEKLTNEEVEAFVNFSEEVEYENSLGRKYNLGIAYLKLGGIKWKVDFQESFDGENQEYINQYAEAVEEDKKEGIMTVDKIQEVVEVKGTEGLEQAPRPLTVYGKLMEVQNMLKAPKNQRNNFGNYNYRSCEDILEGVKGLLAKVGAVILLEDNMELLGDRYYIVATATFVDVEDGSKVEVKARAREALTKKGMDESQITGACSSYARKYALNGLLLIDDNKDADTTKLTREEVIEQLIRLEKLNPKEIKDGIKKSLVKIGVNDLEELKKADWDKIEKWVRSKGGNK